MILMLIQQPGVMSSASSKILIVDDEAPIRVLLERVLAPLPHLVETAEDGQDALEKLVMNQYDLVISDLHMPRMDGMTLLKSVRDRGMDCAFIILTGFGDLSQALRAREEYNIANFLVKPVQHVDQFIFDVETALSRRRLELDNARLMEMMREHNHQLEARVQDRTLELTETNRKLDQLSRFRADILRVLGHELRTPLALLGGYFQLLQGADAGRFPLLAERMGDSIGRLENIMERALNHLRHTNNPRFSLELSAVEPLELCQGVINRIRPLLEDRKIELVFQTGTLPGECMWDVSMLEEVVEELLINAARASADGSPIEFRLEEQNVEDVLITIRDHGCGVPEVDLERIFEPFVTQAESRSHKSGLVEQGAAGPGLGLSLAKLWVKMHNGQIAAHIPQDGPGLEMLLLLPRRAMAATADEGHQPTLEQGTPTRPN